MATQTTPAAVLTLDQLAALRAAHESGSYERDSITGEACLHIAGEWLTEAEVVAALADDDDDADTEIACRILEQGAGLGSVRRGCYVAGSGCLYRVEQTYSGIHTDGRRGNYLRAEVVEVDWDACDEAAIVQARVALYGDDGDDGDDD